MDSKMNERINELVLTARQQATSDTKDGGKQFDLDLFHKKFAELIVRECAQVCLAQRDPANLNYKPSEKFAEAVKQHFGVEE
jgi:hypothetical protein